MTFRLILIRHAKSSWDDATLDDHARPLNARGRRAAPKIGEWLANQGHRPEEVLVSSAVRAQETLSLLGFHAPARVVEALYHAEPTTILKTLHTAGLGSVALIGHNPGLADFAAMLLANPPQDKDFRRFPTCATLVADLPIESWRDLRPGIGRLVDFTVPRRLD